MQDGKTLRLVVVLLGLGILTAPALAADQAGQRFYKAYYLETQENDFEAAAKLYEQVASNSNLSKSVRAKAKVRLAACREELACADFASLMPPHTLFYAELSNPGEHIAGLVKQLGLLGDEDPSANAGKGRRIAISPSLIKGVLGLRGAAVAITGIDMANQAPYGVAILHPGDLDVVRGIIETAVSTGGKQVDAIEGYPTYVIEDEAVVTLTNRLVVVSNKPELIREVLRRLKGIEKTSLATNENLREVLSDRGDALLYFCVNAKALMPMVSGALNAAAAHKPEVAMAAMLLDLESTEAITGRINLGEQGLQIDLRLQLAEGHKNLVYNFLRTPAISEKTFQSIPEGVAGFFAAALNDDNRSMADQRSGTSPPPISALDLGREVFGNIVSFAVYALPGGEGAVIDGEKIPDVALAITVNDPAKSQALWNQILSIASMASGAAATPGDTVEIEGATMHTYKLPEGITIHMATMGRDLLISPSASAIRRSIVAKREGRTVLKDPVFVNALQGIGAETTHALVIHPGRCLEIAKMHMSDREYSEVAAFIPLLKELVVATVINYADNQLSVSTAVTGIPDVSELVSKLAFEHRNGHGHDRRAMASTD